MNDEFPIKCLIDDTGYKTVEHLHLYLRKLKIKQEEYYTKYYQKRDKFTNELIPYKNYEQYFNTDFINKNNLKKYIKQCPEEGKKWAIDFLKKRKEDKNLIYPPTQVELRSLMCPTIHYYESVGGYTKICEELGYKIRYTNPELKFNKLSDKCTIICDSREQKPFNLEGKKKKVKALKFGDYALSGKFNQNIYIERKGPSDFVGTLSKGFIRFEKEIIRAKEKNSYIIVLVESSIGEMLGFNYLPQFKWVKTNPSHIFKNVRDLLHKYDNLQFLFVDSKKEASLMLIKLFELGEQVKNCDLQFLYEAGILKAEDNNL